MPDERYAITPEETVLAIEARTTLMVAVNRLPEIQRDAIVLRYAARLTAREIGDVLGKSNQATQKLLMTNGGVGDAPGEWTVTVDELVGPGDSRLQGPWVLRVGP